MNKFMDNRNNKHVNHVDQLHAPEGNHLAASIRQEEEGIATLTLEMLGMVGGGEFVVVPV